MEIFRIFFLLSLGNALNVKRVPTSGFPPQARSEHSAVYSQNFNLLVIFGGRDDLKYFNDLWVYSFSNNLWTRVYPLTNLLPRKNYLEPRCSAAFFISNSNKNLVHIFGGTGENGPLNDLWSFNLVSRIWNFETVFMKFLPMLYFASDVFTRDGVDYLCAFGGIDVNGHSNALRM